jgi:hypothetical protein
MDAEGHGSAYNINQSRRYKVLLAEALVPAPS